jgi:hypothetical protein
MAILFGVRIVSLIFLYADFDIASISESNRVIMVAKPGVIVQRNGGLCRYLVGLRMWGVLFRRLWVLVSVVLDSGFWLYWLLGWGGEWGGVRDNDASKTVWGKSGVLTARI